MRSRNKGGKSLSPPLPLPACPAGPGRPLACAQRSAPVPVVIRVERNACRRTARYTPTSFKPLLGRVMAELAQRLPVALIPEQLPRSLDPLRVARFLGVFQTGRDLVVNNRCRNRAVAGRAHRAERVQCQERIPRLPPAVAITTGCAAAATIIELTHCWSGTSQTPRRFAAQRSYKPIATSAPAIAVRQPNAADAQTETPME